MKLKVIKIQEMSSKYGGIFYYIFFKGKNGKSYKTCISPKCNNYKRWENIINLFYSKNKTEIWLDNLIIRGTLVDADSDFKINLMVYH